MSLFGRSSNPVVGQPAPDFALPDQDQQIRRLADYSNDWLVLFFYPRDMTPGCTREVCEFQDNYNYFLMTHIQLLGISRDPPDSHRAFRSKHSLGFPLLSDETGDVARAYGSLLNLGPLKLVRRHSFIIDPQGRIAKVYRRVDPANHGFEVVQQLHELTSGS